VKHPSEPFSAEAVPELQLIGKLTTLPQTP